MEGSDEDFLIDGVSSAASIRLVGAISRSRLSTSSSSSRFSGTCRGILPVASEGALTPLFDGGLCILLSFTENQNTLPCVSRFGLYPIWPPISSTRDLAMESPKPVPW